MEKPRGDSVSHQDEDVCPLQGVTLKLGRPSGQTLGKVRAGQMTRITSTCDRAGGEAGATSCVSHTVPPAHGSAAWPAAPPPDRASCKLASLEENFFCENSLLSEPVHQTCKN